MKNPKVSVVIPVYNGEKTLRQCLNSVLNQTYKNYEIVVVDNNSTDNTKKIIKSFESENKKVKYVFEVIVGRGAARNVGINAAIGEIIVMTDADCVVPYQWINKITRPITKGNEFIVQGNEFDIIDNYWTRMQQQFNQKFLMDSVYDVNYIDHLDTKNFAIKKEVLISINMFNEYIKNLEDFELKIRLKKNKYKIFFLKNLKVKHYHKDNFRDLFERRIEQGYWITVIYKIHKKYLKRNDEKMIKSISLFDFIIFFPRILIFALKHSPKSTFFEFITQIAWRSGIMLALINTDFE